ncbi:uncharacterized protein LOC110118152 [Ceratitis capitata]|uniref:uncharacterized protein LOC110118152 n=1 Tax=Ceratitis capitata TaxID=7213 RepID=UPI000A121862|nr:uncharacterized protein LOC110118152 [Ceratitis capitata]
MQKINRENMGVHPQKLHWLYTIIIKPYSLVWYTDGSKTTDGIGAGVTGPRIKVSIPMGKYPSIFQAEVFANTICAELILKRKMVDHHIVICSDSQAPLKAISSCIIKSYRDIAHCVSPCTGLEYAPMKFVGSVSYYQKHRCTLYLNAELSQEDTKPRSHSAAGELH